MVKAQKHYFAKTTTTKVSSKLRSFMTKFRDTFGLQVVSNDASDFMIVGSTIALQLHNKSPKTIKMVYAGDMDNLVKHFETLKKTPTLDSDSINITEHKIELNMSILNEFNDKYYSSSSDLDKCMVYIYRTTRDFRVVFSSFITYPERICWISDSRGYGKIYASPETMKMIYNKEIHFVQKFIPVLNIKLNDGGYISDLTFGQTSVDFTEYNQMIKTGWKLATGDLGDGFSDSRVQDYIEFIKEKIEPSDWGLWKELYTQNPLEPLEGNTPFKFYTEYNFENNEYTTRPKITTKNLTV